MSIREDLKAFIDGELDEPRNAEVRAAIERDPELEREIALLRAIGDEIRAMAPEPVAKGLERTLDSLRSRSTGWRPPRITRLAAAVGLPLLLGAALFITIRPSLSSKVSDSRAEVALSKSPATGSEDWADTAVQEPGAPLSRENPDGRETRVESKLESPADSTLPAPSSTSVDKRIVKTAQLAFRVSDALKAAAKARAIAASFGGYYQNSSNATGMGNLPVASLVLRVPEKSFDLALDRLRAIEPGMDVITDSSNNEDVTAEYLDTESRLRTLRAAEARYRAIMGQTKKIGEVLNVQERLDEVRTEIEGLETQRRYLGRQSAMATISVTFEQRPAPGSPEGSSNWAAEAWSNAVNGLLAVIRALAQAAVFLFVFAPIWLPVLLLMVVLVRRALK